MVSGGSPKMSEYDAPPVQEILTRELIATELAAVLWVCSLHLRMSRRHLQPVQVAMRFGGDKGPLSAVLFLRLNSSDSFRQS